MPVFTFTPPPSPEHTPSPCPVCNSQEGFPVYATSRAQYYRCTSCRQIFSHTDTDNPAPAAA